MSGPSLAVRLAAAVLSGMACLAVAAVPPDYADFSELDLEALLDQTIVTAAKHTQKVSDAPVAATVITAEEIAASGARSIPELLRTVPGLDVLQATSSTFDVSARGLNKPGSNAMLVLVDGRSVYDDVYGLVIWDQLTVSLEDIRVIEVIKGPGSAMHGANAFAGVINIITYAPGEQLGSTARTMVSDLGEAYGALRHAGRRADLSWKLTTIWDRSSDWEQDAPEAENVRFDAQARWTLRPDSWLAIGAGHNNGRNKLAPVSAPLTTDGVQHHVRADYVRADLMARWFTNAYDVTIDAIDSGLMGARTRLKSRLHDFEFQHALRPWSGHHVVWGGSYRHRRTEYGQPATGDDENIYAGFVLEEWSPRPDLRFSFGVRYEHHSLVGGHLSPRGGLVYKPAARHHLRLSYSKAYRDPAYVESRWRTEIELAPGVNQIVRGDLDNQSEEIASVEIGYQGMVRDGLLLTAALFHNRMDKIIAMETVATFPSPPALIPGMPSELAFVNGPSWIARGGEASLRTDPATWLRLTGQYSFVWLTDADTDERIERAPAHAAAAVARVRAAAGHHLQLTGRYRSASVWGDNHLPDDVAGEARLVLDAAWQVQPDGGKRRLTLAVENLLDRRFRDHSLAIEQRRRISASVMIGF